MSAAFSADGEGLLTAFSDDSVNRPSISDADKFLLSPGSTGDLTRTGLKEYHERKGVAPLEAPVVVAAVAAVPGPLRAAREERVVEGVAPAPHRRRTTTNEELDRAGAARG